LINRVQRHPTSAGRDSFKLSIPRLLGVLGELNHLSAISLKKDLCAEVRASSANRMHSAAF
jgi:hypothetical protein